MGNATIDWQKTYEDIIKKSWRDPKYLETLCSDPKAVLAEELGMNLPEAMSVVIHEDTNDTFHFVLPVNPEIAKGELSESALGEVAGGLRVPFVFVAATVPMPGVGGVVLAAWATGEIIHATKK